MKVKRMGIKEILRRIWLFSTKRTKSADTISKEPTQLIVQLNSSLWHIIVTLNYTLLSFLFFSMTTLFLQVADSSDKPKF